MFFNYCAVFLILECLGYLIFKAKSHSRNHYIISMIFFCIDGFLLDLGDNYSHVKYGYL